GRIGRVRTLGDDAFQRQPAGPRIELRALPDLVIAVLQGRTSFRQQISKSLLSLTQRRGADHLAVEVQQIKQEEDESGGVARIRSRLDQAERGLPVPGNAA